MVSFVYSPLPSSRAIRVLIVNPSASRDAPIDCELRTTDLDDDHIKYDALSYVWGIDEDRSKRRIVLHGSEHRITTNLETALRRLRHADRPREIWVDAVCTNQDDLAERASQVQMMAEIYNKSAATISWLGEGDADSDEAVEVVKEVAHRVIMFLGRIGDTIEKDHSTMKRRTSMEQLVRDRDFNWPSVWRLFERPYWSRVWVIQELAAHHPNTTSGRSDYFFCGEKMFRRLDYELFCIFVSCVETIGPEGPDEEVRPPDATTASEVAARLRAFDFKTSLRSHGLMPGIMMYSILNSVDDKTRSLDRLLLLTGRMKATDPRDRLFALRGLANDGDLVIPDYSKSYEDTLISYALSSIRKYCSLQVLLGNRPRDPCRNPSWVPYLISNEERPAVGGLISPESDYRAAGLFKPIIPLNPTPKSLFCRGVRIGEINSVIGPIPNQASLAELQQILFELPPQAGIDGLARLREYYLSLHDPCDKESFWRTLCADTQFRDGNPLSPAPPDYESRFHVAFGLEPWPVDKMHLSQRQVFAERFFYVAPFADSLSYSLQSRTFICLGQEDSDSNSGRQTLQQPNKKPLQMGLGPLAARKGDIVVAMFGAPLFLVLEPLGRAGAENQYRLVGDAWIQGAMNGELVQGITEGGGEVFELV